MSEEIDTTTNFMLTTVDNPYSPFTEFVEWLAFDMQMGYNTPGLLARFAATSHELSDADNDIALAEAMQMIVTENIYGVHKIVSFKEQNPKST